MKRFLFIAVVAMFVMCANAQRLGITGGLNVSRLMKSNYDSRIGFNVGGKWEYDVVSGFFYEGDLLLSRKGFVNEADNDHTLLDPDEYGVSTFSDTKEKYKCGLYYLELPIYWGYSFNVNDNFQITPKGGGYVAVGLFGDSNGIIGSFPDSYTRLDAGLCVGANTLFGRHFELSIGGEFGLIETCEYANSQNCNVYANFAYIF